MEQAMQVILRGGALAAAALVVMGIHPLARVHGVELGRMTMSNATEYDECGRDEACYDSAKLE